MVLADLLAGAGVGVASGFTAGLLGVSPGGGLVVISILLLGVDQHVAQGTSLVAQIPPTSLAGIGRYRRDGARSPLRWLALLAAGYVAGGVIGAWGASHVADRALRWTYVAYLVLLDVLLIVRSTRAKRAAHDDTRVVDPGWPALVAVGLAAGLSSGFMGIGGGLATMVGLGAVLGVPQHQAQMVSLALSLIPATAPSAWVYWKDGLVASWPALVGVVIGLAVGTDAGARLANAVDSRTLRWLSIAFVAAMAIYMAVKALS